jgi:hypothetical protein
MPGLSNRESRDLLDEACRCGGEGRRRQHTFPTIWNNEKDPSRGGELARARLDTDRLLGGGVLADQADLASVGDDVLVASRRSMARAGSRPDGRFAREIDGEPIAAMESTRASLSVVVSRPGAVAQGVVPGTRISMARPC